MTYINGEGVIRLFRPFTQEELEKTKELIPAVEASIRLEADSVDKDSRELLRDENYLKVFKSVVMDVAGRTLMTSAD